MQRNNIYHRISGSVSRAERGLIEALADKERLMISPMITRMMWDYAQRNYPDLYNDYQQRHRHELIQTILDKT